MRDHRSLRYKRYSQSGSNSPATRARSQELLELLQLLNGNRNDLDAVGNYLLAPNANGNSDRDLDAVDLQPETFGQSLRNSLPAGMLDQTEPDVFAGEPEFIAEPDEGNEPSSYYLRQAQQEDNISPSRGRQVSPSLDSARIRFPPSTWGRMAGNGDDAGRDDPLENDSDLTRLAKLYEALLKANRN